MIKGAAPILPVAVVNTTIAAVVFQPYSNENAMLDKHNGSTGHTYVHQNMVLHLASLSATVQHLLNAMGVFYTMAQVDRSMLLCCHTFGNVQKLLVGKEYENRDDEEITYSLKDVCLLFVCYMQFFSETQCVR